MLDTIVTISFYYFHNKEKIQLLLLLKTDIDT